MKTMLHWYYFESGDHPGYLAMIERIKANADGRGPWMNCLAEPGKSNNPATRNSIKSEEVELETTYLFDNQWNGGSMRLFDWFEGVYPNRSMKSGHWLEITPEMAKIRRETLKCGYCGKHYGPNHEPAPGAFCSACLDSEYLKQTDLKLLRLYPIVSESGSIFKYDHKPFPELTAEEIAELLPKYVERQTTGSDSRAAKRRAKQRADIIKKHQETVEAATDEKDGLLWLWDHNVNLDNVIYYSHTRKFSFGWRQPVSFEVKSALLDIISEFPFDYEIKTADLGTLEKITR